MKNQNWKKLSLFILGLLAFVYLGVAALIYSGIYYFIMPKIEEEIATIRRYQEQILRDIKTLDSNPIFVESKRAKNAEEFLSGRIGWVGADENDQALHPHPDSNKLVELQKDHHTPFNKEGLNRLASDPRLLAVDLSWIDQLESFDHWYLGSSKPVQAGLEKARSLDGVGRVGVMASLPIPDFNLLRFAATARFLQLVKRGGGLKAMRAIRHIAYLFHTTHTLVGSASAVATLNHEHTLVENFHVVGWKPIEKERTLIYKKLSWAWGALLSLEMWDTLPDSFLPFMKPHNSVCAMVNETTLTAGTLEFLEPQWPLEPNYSVQLKKNKDLSLRLFEICSMPEYTFLLEPAKETAKGEGFDYNKLPFLRRGFGLVLLTLARPGYLKQYVESDTH